MARMQMFIVALLSVSLLVTGSMLFLADSTAQYGITTYDNSSLESYNKLDELTTLSDDFENRTNSISIDTGLLDTIGGFLTQAYSAVRITQQSYDTFVTIGDESIESINLDAAFEGIIKTFIFTVVLFAVIFIIIKYFVKVDP